MQTIRLRSSSAPPPSTVSPALQSQYALIRRVQAGDRQAKEELVQKFTGLIRQIANRYHGRGVDPEDLHQEGAIGLLRAAQKFDSGRGLHFSTYAIHWVRQAIQRGVINQASAIRLPNHVHDAAAKVKRHQAALEEEGQDATPERIAERACLSPVTVKTLLSLPVVAGSLDTPIGDGKGVYGELFADEADGPEAQTQAILRRERITRAFSVLQPKEAAILCLRYGLDGGGERTLEETGAAVGLTRERARQLEQRAIKKLRSDERALYLLASAR